MTSSEKPGRSRIEASQASSTGPCSLSSSTTMCTLWPRSSSASITEPKSRSRAKRVMKTKTIRSGRAASVRVAEASAGAVVAGMEFRLPSFGGLRAREPPPMNVLFLLRRPGTIRNYAGPIALLAERGHSVRILYSRLVAKSTGPDDLGPTIELAARFPNVTYGEAPGRSTADGWVGTARVVRVWGDFARYLHPRFADAPLLRERAAHRAKLAVRPRRLGPRGAAIGFRLADSLAKVRSAAAADALGGLFRHLEAAVPPSGTLVAFLRQIRPDAVVVSPLVDTGSDQAEYVKAAQVLGIPSAAAIASWDNLSTKGVIRVRPDRVLVWNEVQRREAAEMHGVPPERVVITGAPRFDAWFERSPSRPREVFMAEVGLPSDRPYALYLCSSPFIAPNESPFVQRWAAAIRASDDPEVHRLGILVRPYPQNAELWDGVDLTGVGARVWPRTAAWVDNEAAAADFYDAIAHSAVVVGINTSALIEAAIAGKNVLTVLDGDFAGTQRGTLHYHYLLHENGGFLREAADLDEHLSQLAAVLHDPGAAEEQTRRFVASFVRPLDRGVPASAAFADAIEQLAARPAAAPRLGVAPRLLRAILAAAAAVRRRRLRHTPAPEPRPGAARRAERAAALERELRAEGAHRET